MPFCPKQHLWRTKKSEPEKCCAQAGEYCLIVYKNVYSISSYAENILRKGIIVRLLH